MATKKTHATKKVTSKADLETRNIVENENHDFLLATSNRFTNRPIEERKFNSGIVKFSKLYNINNFWVKLVIAALLGIFMGTSTALLVEGSGLYTGGTGAFFQGIARLVKTLIIKGANSDVISSASSIVAPVYAEWVYQAIFWGLYLIMNIPLTIFAFKKIGKNFAIISIVFLAFNQLTGFAIGMIFDTLGTSFHLLGSTETVDPILRAYGVQNVNYGVSVFPTYVDGSGDLVWTSLYTVNELHSLTQDQIDFITYTVTNANVTRSLSLFLYTMVYAGISGLVYSLIFIIGGSTAGSDYITIYVSEAKNKSTGSIFTILNASFMFCGIVLGTFASTIVARPEYASYQIFFSGNMLASLSLIFLIGLIIDKIFPWSKMVEVRMYTRNSKKIVSYLKEIQYTHSFYDIPTTKNNDTNQDWTLLVTTSMCIELPKLIQIIRKIDDSCLIATKVINDIDGRIKVQKRTDH